MLFTNAYTNAPICVPARASLATGRQVHEIQKWDNCQPYRGEEPSWGHRLLSAGRRAVSIGKLHYRNEADPNGFDASHLPLHILDGVGMLNVILRDPLPASRQVSSASARRGRRYLELYGLRIATSLNEPFVGFANKGPKTVNHGHYSFRWFARTRRGSRPKSSTNNTHSMRSTYRARMR